MTLARDATHDADGDHARMPTRAVQMIFLVEVAAAFRHVVLRRPRRFRFRRIIRIASLAAVGRVASRGVLRRTRQRRTRVARAVDAVAGSGATTHRAFHVTVV